MKKVAKKAFGFVISMALLAPFAVFAGPPVGISSSTYTDPYGNPSGTTSFCLGEFCNQNSVHANAGWTLSNPYGLPEGSIIGIISNLLFWLLMVFAIVGVIGFVLSGIFYLLAGADESMVEKGKDGMKWSIIGVIVGLSGFLILQAANMLLSGASKSF